MQKLNKELIIKVKKAGGGFEIGSKSYALFPTREKAELFSGDSKIEHITRPWDKVGIYGFRISA